MLLADYQCVSCGNEYEGDLKSPSTCPNCGGAGKRIFKRMPSLHGVRKGRGYRSRSFERVDLPREYVENGRVLDDAGRFKDPVTLAAYQRIGEGIKRKPPDKQVYDIPEKEYAAEKVRQQGDY